MERERSMIKCGGTLTVNSRNNYIKNKRLWNDSVLPPRFSKQGLTKGMDILSKWSLTVRTENRSEIILQASLSPICFWPLCTPLFQPNPLLFPEKTQTHSFVIFIAILEVNSHLLHSEETHNFMNKTAWMSDHHHQTFHWGHISVSVVLLGSKFSGWTEG